MASILAITSFLGALPACAERDSQEAANTTEGAGGSAGGESGTPGENGGTPPVQDILPQESPNFVYAKGWEGITLNANKSITVIKTVGHLTTTKNICERKGEAFFKLDEWNALSTLVNKIVVTEPRSAPSPLPSATPVSAERCVPSSENSKFWNLGIAEVTLANGTKRKLLEYKNAEICSTIADPATADQFLAMIEKALIKADCADAQECPNYLQRCKP